MIHPFSNKNLLKISCLDGIETSRLKLRQFAQSDVIQLACIMNKDEIYETTLNIPRKSSIKKVEKWVVKTSGDFGRGNPLRFAIENKFSSNLIGCVELNKIKEHDIAEIGYWIDPEQWNNGFCTEAVKALVNFAFFELEINKIYATHMSTNPRSGQVLKKLGFKQEGYLRQHKKKDGIYKDLLFYGLLKCEVQDGHIIIN